MAKIRLLAVGAGGHGRSVAEASELSGHSELLCFLDNSLPVGETVPGVPVLGPVTITGCYGARKEAASVLHIGRR
jgi:FlaA1/EpsC-like NDP-sugar epimerase